MLEQISDVPAVDVPVVLFVPSTAIMRTACERELRSFMFVEAVARFECPARNNWNKD